MDNLVQPEEKRIARLNEYITQIEEAMSRIVKSINEGDKGGYSEEEIRFYLSTLPDMIAQAGLLLAKINRDYYYAKIDVKIITSEVWKKCNRLKEGLGLSNAKDREAFVQTQPEIIKAQQSEVEWKYRLDQMQIIYDRYNNMFVSARKLASMLSKEMFDHGV